MRSRSRISMSRRRSMRRMRRRESRQAAGSKSRDDDSSDTRSGVMGAPPAVAVARAGNLDAPLEHDLEDSEPRPSPISADQEAAAGMWRRRPAASRVVDVRNLERSMGALQGEDGYAPHWADPAGEVGAVAGLMRRRPAACRALVHADEACGDESEDSPVGPGSTAAALAQMFSSRCSMGMGTSLDGLLAPIPEQGASDDEDVSDGLERGMWRVTRQ